MPSTSQHNVVYSNFDHSSSRGTGTGTGVRMGQYGYGRTGGAVQY
jgi:hypothetical protein